MVVLQQMIRPRVVAGPQVVGCPIAKSAYPCRQHPLLEEGSAENSPNKREVRTVFRGSCELENSRRARDKYAREVKALPFAMVQTMNSNSQRGIMLKTEDIIFIETDAS